jgi:hypothetical protein
MFRIPYEQCDLPKRDFSEHFVCFIETAVVSSVHDFVQNKANDSARKNGRTKRKRGGWSTWNVEVVGEGSSASRPESVSGTDS